MPIPAPSVPGSQTPRTLQTSPASSLINRAVVRTDSERDRFLRETADAAESSLPARPGSPEIIRERYPNGALRIQCEAVKDEHGNRVNHGPWKEWDPAGKLLAEGHFVRGERQGAWQRIHKREDSALFSQPPYRDFQPPFVSRASFENGKLDGAWVIVDAEDRKISEWKYSAGSPHGKSIWWHPNGEPSRAMDFKQGTIDGEIFEWDGAGRLLSRAQFIDGRKLSTKTEYFPSGQKRLEASYLEAAIVPSTGDDWWNAKPAVFSVDGKQQRHGVWTTWHANGQTKSRGQFKHDEEDGVFTWWYENGQKSMEGEFSRGSSTGDWAWWHKNGQKSASGAYQAGEEVGRWVEWNEEGKVIRVSEYSLQ